MTKIYEKDCLLSILWDDDHTILYRLYLFVILWPKHLVIFNFYKVNVSFIYSQVNVTYFLNMWDDDDIIIFLIEKLFILI